MSVLPLPHRYAHANKPNLILILWGLASCLSNKMNFECVTTYTEEIAISFNWHVAKIWLKYLDLFIKIIINGSFRMLIRNSKFIKPPICMHVFSKLILT